MRAIALTSSLFLLLFVIKLEENYGVIFQRANLDKSGTRGVCMQYTIYIRCIYTG